MKVRSTARKVAAALALTVCSAAAAVAQQPAPAPESQVVQAAPARLLPTGPRIRESPQRVEPSYNGLTAAHMHRRDTVILSASTLVLVLLVILLVVLL